MVQPRYTPDENHAVKHRERFSDTSSTLHQIWSLLKQFEVATVIVIMFCIAPMITPNIVWLSIVVVPLMVITCMAAEENVTLPLKLPEMLGKIKDRHDNKPGRRWSYNYAQGTVLLGNQQFTDKELWLAGGDLLTHALAIGTTGSGKTVALVGLAAATAFCRGGGLLYIDAKAGPELMYEISALCRIFGREDDLRVINYSLAGRSTKERNYKKLSNTTSPFAHGTDSQAVTTLTDTMASGGSDNKFFENRAIALLKILMPVLCELRDMGAITIRPSTITEYMAISQFMELSQNKIWINGVHRTDISIRESTCKSIETFLKQLGVDFGKPHSEQNAEVNTQFSYAEGYFALSMANFSGTFGHIYETVLAEADFVDVVLHNRILLVMIPAMQQSAEEISSLGKIVLAALKVALSLGLGGDNAGDYADTIGSLPVDQRVPTVTIIDEYPAIVVDGFATAATQGRSVGMVCVFSGQDFPGFTGANPKEADQIFGSTRLKILLATEDAGDTLRKFQELAGKHAVAEGHGWERGTGMLDSFQNNIGASIHEVDRIDIKEINEQDKGEAHIFYRGKVIRGNMFFAGIKEDQVKDNFRFNQLLPIEAPKHDRLNTLVNIRRQVAYLEKIADFDSTTINETLIDEIGYWATKGGPDWPTKVLLRFNEPSTSPSPAQKEPARISESPSEIQMTVDILNEVNQIDEDVAPIDFSSMPSYVIANPNDDLEEAIFDSPVENKDRAAGINHKTTSSADSSLSSILAEAKNSWVFTALATASGNPRRCEDIVETLSSLNCAIGMNDVDADLAAVNSVKILSEELIYPSQPVEARPDDADELFRAIEELSRGKA